MRSRVGSSSCFMDATQRSSYIRLDGRLSLLTPHDRVAVNLTTKILRTVRSSHPFTAYLPLPGVFSIEGRSRVMSCRGQAEQPIPEAGGKVLGLWICPLFAATSTRLVRSSVKAMSRLSCPTRCSTPGLRSPGKETQARAERLRAPPF